jgi:hypothetical protein
LPAIATAHSEGVVVALAVRDPFKRPGLAILPLEAGAERPELLAARQAAAKATGAGAGSGPACLKIAQASDELGEILVAVPGVPDGSEPEASPGLHRAAIRVWVAKRGTHVWAWTLGEEVLV